MSVIAWLRQLAASFPKSPMVLLRKHRLQQQILIVETEVRQRRHGFHSCVVNAAVRIVGEGDVRIFDSAVAPMRFERFVLPVLKVADHGRGVVKGHHEMISVLPDGDGSIPIVGIHANKALNRAQLAISGIVSLWWAMN